ncbi:MAG: DUF554 domain-containing protein [Lachnospiraceae bacterium]|nr:DUF554 domain-containing protein [Lachnospiraceae bacterium]
MLGTIVNVATVVAGSCIGLFLKKGIREDIADMMLKGLALCSMFIGITSALEGQNVLITIISIVLGVIIGGTLDLDGKLNGFAQGLENKFKREGEKVSIAEGFITASLVFCVGAMTIVGSLQSGLIGDHTMLFTKATLDFVSSMVYASSLGIGVLFSAAFVFVFQGSITLLAQWIAPLLTDAVIAEMTCAGGLLIFGLGLNMIGLTKLKLMNYLPAIFLPMVLVPAADWLAVLF